MDFTSRFILTFLGIGHHLISGFLLSVDLEQFGCFLDITTIIIILWLGLFLHFPDSSAFGRTISRIF